MRLTLQTDYSFRVLMHLSVNQERLVTIREISECFDISKNHLMKVVHHLSLLGYIETTRGKNGGMCLGLDPEAISLGALVRKTEPDLAMVECFLEHGKCRLEPGCKLSGIMTEALSAFLAVLDKYSLADLIANPLGIASLLGIPYSADHAA